MCCAVFAHCRSTLLATGTDKNRRSRHWVQSIAAAIWIGNKTGFIDFKTWPSLLKGRHSTRIFLNFSSSFKSCNQLLSKNKLIHLAWQFIFTLLVWIKLRAGSIHLFYVSLSASPYSPFKYEPDNALCSLRIAPGHWPAAGGSKAVSAGKSADRNPIESM